MDKIYIVRDNPTGYDEDSLIVGFALTEDEAKSFIVKEERDYARAKMLVSNLERIREVFEECLKPLETEARIEKQKWAAGISEKSITQEMRIERNRINAENEEITNRNTIKHNERNKLIRDFMVNQIEIAFEGYENAKKYIEVNPAYGFVGVTSLYEPAPFSITSINRVV